MIKPPIDLIDSRIRSGWTYKTKTGPANNAKISEMKVREIWEDYKSMSGASVKTSIPKMLAKKHRVSCHIVSNIVYGNAWNRITGLPKRDQAWY